MLGKPDHGHYNTQLLRDINAVCKLLNLSPRFPDVPDLQPDTGARFACQYFEQITSPSMAKFWFSGLRTYGWWIRPNRTVGGLYVGGLYCRWIESSAGWIEAMSAGWIEICSSSGLCVQWIVLKVSCDEDGCWAGWCCGCWR